MRLLVHIMVHIHYCAHSQTQRSLLGYSRAVMATATVAAIRKENLRHDDDAECCIISESWVGRAHTEGGQEKPVGRACNLAG